MTDKTARTPKLTILRLLLGGALVGVSVAGILGVDTSAVLTTAFGASGAVIAGVALKMTHVF